MALHIKALNNDTSFLLSFIPSICPFDQKFPETFPGAFTILVDPIAPVADNDDVLTRTSCITSLNDVSEPDAILISHSLPDHCHEDSLCQLSPHIQSMIVGEPDAIKTIKRWRHFDHGNISSLRRYKRGREDTLFRVEIPPPSPYGTPGEVTIAFLAPKSSGMHNAVGITYREPSSILSRSRALVSPTMSRVSSPQSPDSVASLSTAKSECTVSEPTIAAIYTPHGVPYEVVEPWVTAHVASQDALPPLALFHSTTAVNASWYKGGNLIAGCPGGVELARQLLPTTWIAANDVENVHFGGTKNVWRTEYKLRDVEAELWEGLIARGVKRKPQLLRLAPGATVRVEQFSVSNVVDDTPMQDTKQAGNAKTGIVTEASGTEASVMEASVAPAGMTVKPA